MRNRCGLLPRLLVSGWLVTGIASSVTAQETAAYFKQNCANCHTIGGGRLTGPDLKDVTKRKDRDWLSRFIRNPQEFFDAGDPYATRLLRDHNNVPMPKPPDMTADRARAVLELIDNESKLPRSQFAGIQIPDRPPTEEDIELGREYFLGHRRFANGGPSCASCHNVTGLGGLGGGRLGPKYDLTKVCEKLGGRKPLAAWLVSPGAPIMQPVYKQHSLETEEIIALVAYLEDAGKNEVETDSVAALNFFLLGLGGAGLGLVLFDVMWKKRFRGVRRSLVQGDVARGES